MELNDKQLLVVDIKYNTLDDGPGIRTAVFFKGCPLRCEWCHNPEAICRDPELAWMEKDCLGCGQCSVVCRHGAANGKGSVRHDRLKCVACFNCVDSCPAGARKAAGKYYGVDELLRLLLRDLPFYRNSGGGVTLTGGEPMMQMELASALIRSLKENGVHTLIETCGMFNMTRFEELVLPFVDMIYFDVKLLDGDKHRLFTGSDNTAILRNLETLALKSPDKVFPRVPLVPGMTATDENLVAIAGMLRRLGFKDSALLPYNPLWFDKAKAVGRGGVGAERSFMKKEELDRLGELFFRILRA